jgi:hypothetical protein
MHGGNRPACSISCYLASTGLTKVHAARRVEVNCVEGRFQPCHCCNEACLCGLRGSLAVNLLQKGGPANGLALEPLLGATHTPVHVDNVGLPALELGGDILEARVLHHVDLLVRGQAWHEMTGLPLEWEV